jgi:A/G-specific adenine glycosylase
MKQPRRFAPLLLDWYHKSARDLPWRRTRDAYKIWVSEIMLQQTQVQTVIPYYERWLKRFPDVRSLADAPESEIMKLWAGLGYYRRARMLHKASKEIAENYGWKLPTKSLELLELPGIGRYTAGAVASIAFGERTPVLDGNVMRILTRLYALKDDIAKPASVSKLWELARSLVPEENPGDFNQAMMELGATVCTPLAARCGDCPVSVLCEAKKQGRWQDYPFKRNRAPLEKIKMSALVLRKNGRVLLERQPSDGRWGGLWMFPHSPDNAALLKDFALSKEAVKRILTVNHGFTKYSVQLDVYEYSAGKPASCREKEQKWVILKDLSQIALPSPHRKIAQSLCRETN